MDDNIIGIGSEFKLNLNIPSVNGVTMDDYDFIVDIYCSNRNAVSIKKEEAIRVDSDNYILLVDSLKLKHGNVKCKVTAYIPDRDFEDGLRTEVAFIDTNITIIKNI